MAVRTVSVELKMQLADFLRGAGEASAATKLLGHEFDDLGKKSNSFSTAKPTKEMQNFSRVITASLRDGKTGFQSIQLAIDDTKTRIAGLRRQVHTGSGSDSIFGDLKSAQKDLRVLEGIFKDIGGEVEKTAEPAGRSFGQSFLAGTQKVLAANPLGGAIGLGIIAAATPFIVAGLSAAIAGGVGLGLIAAAAIIQHNNPILESAFTQFTKDAGETGRAATTALVTPFQLAIQSADRFVLREGPALAKVFTNLAPAIAPIEADLEMMGATLLPALAKAAQGFTKAFGSQEVTGALTALDNQLAGLFNTIGNHPKEIADGFNTLFTVINAGVATVKGIIDAYAEADAKLRQWHDDIQNWIDVQGGASKSNGEFLTTSQQVVDAGIKAAGGIDQYNKELAQLQQQTAISKGDLSSLATELNNTAVTADTLAASLEAKVFNSMMSSDQATLAWNESLTNLSATLKENKNVTTESANSTIKHRQAAEADTAAVLGAVSANQQIYQTMVASGVSSYDAARAYDANEKALRKQLLAAGLTKKQVDGLIGSYDKVPDNVNTAIAVKGLTDAINNLDETLRLINHLDGLHATATVTTVYKTKGHPLGGAFAQSISRWGNIYEPAADGLLTHAQVYSPVNPGRFMIAEPATGGEAFIPKNGNYGRSMSIIKAAAGWYGASVTPGGGSGGGGGAINLYVMAGDDTSKALVKSLRYGISQGGGDPVRVLTPKGA